MMWDGVVIVLLTALVWSVIFVAVASTMEHDPREHHPDGS